MKRNILLVSISIAAVLAILVTGCTKTHNDQTVDKLSVVTTIFPPYDFVRAIAADLVELTMLIPPGSESHSFDPAPRDIIKIQNCDVFIYVGGDSDTWITNILATMDTSNMTIIKLMDLVDVVEEEIIEGMEHDHAYCEDPSHDHSHGYEYDEHVWTSPLNAKRMVEQIASVLIARDEAHAQTYALNAEHYASEFTDIDLQLQQVMTERKRSTVVFGDRFPFRYLADAYDLTYYAAFTGCSGQTDASAQTVAFLITKIREEQIPVVFHLELSNGRMATTISEETGAKNMLLHSGHNVTRDDFASGITLADLMRRNVEALQEALY